MPLTDREIIAKHSTASARVRAQIELDIVNKLIAEAKRQGYTLKIVINEHSSDKEFKELLFDLDTAKIFVFDKSVAQSLDVLYGKCLGWILLVFGNDGYDLISDYTLSLEKFLKPVIRFANTYSD